MTYVFWEYAACASCFIFLLTILVMIIFGFTRNRYYHEHHKDELIKESKTANSKNCLYFTNGETLRYIKKYVLCNTSLDKYVIVNYNREYRSISFFVLCYNNLGHVIRTLKYTETQTGLSSKIISVPNGTHDVNIVIRDVDDQVINYGVIKPLSLKQIKYNAIFMGVLVFSFLFVLRHMIFAFGAIGFSLVSNTEYLVFRGLLEKSLLSYENYALVLLSLIVGILTMLKSRKVYKKKNKKLAGGTVEYDFSE